MDTKRFIIMFLSCTRWIQPTPSHSTSFTSILITSSNLFLGYQMVPSSFPTKLLQHFSSPHYVPRVPPTSSSLLHPKNIWRDVQTMKFLAMQFSPVTCYFLPGPNMFLSSIFSNTLSQRSSRKVADQVLCSSKTTWNIIVQTVSLFNICTNSATAPPLI